MSKKKNEPYSLPSTSVQVEAFISPGTIKIDDSKITSVYERKKLYLKKEDVWAIDLVDDRELCTVYVRETSFRVLPENIVLY